MRCGPSQLGLYALALFLFLAVGCSPVPHLQFVSLQRVKGESQQQILNRWRTSINRDTPAPQKYEVLIHEKKRSGDSHCNEPQRIAERVFSFPGTLSMIGPGQRRYNDFRWGARIWLAVGKFHLRYEETTPSLEEAIKDVRRLIEVAGAGLAVCVVSWADDSPSQVRSIHGHVMAAIGHYDHDCDGRRN